MGNLFIIGNGFDLSHELKTSYEDFHSYLRKTYPNAQPTDCVPEYLTDNHGNEVPNDEDEVIGFIEQLLCDVDGDKWSNLEASIGKVDFENYLMDYEHDDDDDNEEWHETYFNENNAIALVNPILEIPSYFNKWISALDVKKAIVKNDFLKLIDKDSDLFLSFNYTPTLEDVYKIKNVCHIHGVQGGNLLFGHGEDYDYFSDDNYGMRPGTEDSFQNIHDKLRKDTKSALAQHRTFFQSLNPSVNKIYSFGFSFSDVDEVYIREICSRLDTSKVTWLLNGFDSESTRSDYQNIIKKCGFNGSFAVYNVMN